MILAVDSSVLLAIFKGESTAEAWVDLLVKKGRKGRLVVCEVVVAEVAALFPESGVFGEALENLGVAFSPTEQATAEHAGRLFRRYRREGGPREHLIPDFLIGAHAELQADALAAVDRGYLRRYFDGLRVESI